MCQRADPPPVQTLQLSATLRFIPSVAVAAGVLPATGPQPFLAALLDSAAAAAAPMWRRFGYCVRQPWHLTGGRNATVYVQVQLVLVGPYGNTGVWTVTAMAARGVQGEASCGVRSCWPAPNPALKVLCNP